MIPSNAYTDPNGYTIDFHLVKYDPSRRTGEEVEKAYEELVFDSSNWRWNKKEVILNSKANTPALHKRTENIFAPHHIRQKVASLLFLQSHTHTLSDVKSLQCLIQVMCSLTKLNSRTSVQWLYNLTYSKNVMQNLDTQILV